ncbi:PEP-CTERM sorting domain-containing protein [Candidatus Uabimicrobium amorphum]|uniref:Ice-binding protein C-terminal domain-containing protein n=1 Tax=Uabimicrobium amorphum TaxID=2596890 RepID=A0A5S9IMP4_UABAM|nr:PEP-CTERM sorting domain-containing protein [Candidatus Uabimicrobium amorphum]BBM84534.1 hypothetical protein UABAM_02895 [Candidatus Uabimicrobium amorphum]
MFQKLMIFLLMLTTPNIFCETIFSLDLTGQEINQNNSINKKNASFSEVGTSLSITQTTPGFMNLELFVASAGQINPTEDITFSISSTQTRSSAGDLDIFYALLDSSDISTGIFIVDEGNVANFRLEDMTGTTFNGNRNNFDARNDQGISAPLHNFGEQGLLESTFVFSGGDVTINTSFNGVSVSQFTVANPIDLTSDLRFVLGLNDIGENFTVDNLSINLFTNTVPEPSTYLAIIVGLLFFGLSRRKSRK